MIKIQLNGWQRLWVLFAIAYLVVVILFTFNVIAEQRNQILSSWVSDAVALISARKSEVNDAVNHIPVEVKVAPRRGNNSAEPASYNFRGTTYVFPTGTPKMKLLDFWPTNTPWATTC